MPRLGTQGSLEDENMEFGKKGSSRLQMGHQLVKEGAGDGAAPDKQNNAEGELVEVIQTPGDAQQ